MKYLVRNSGLIPKMDLFYLLVRFKKAYLPRKFSVPTAKHFLHFFINNFMEQNVTRENVLISIEEEGMNAGRKVRVFRFKRLLSSALKVYCFFIFYLTGELLEGKANVNSGDGGRKNLFSSIKVILFVLLNILTFAFFTHNDLSI